MEHPLRVAFAIASLVPLAAQAATLHVPQDYSTIQAAIDAAVTGDVVRVAAGTYTENLIIEAKAISVVGAGAASTIVDGGASGRVLSISAVTTGQVLIAALTIRNGAAFSGAGIHASSANLFLRDSVLTANQGCSGVALRFDFTTLRLLRNRITGNQPLEPGCGSEAVDVLVGGLNYFDYNVIADNSMSGMTAYSDGGTMYFRHNVFRDNVQNFGSTGSAAGLSATGDVIVQHNLFADNSGVWNGGAYLNQQEQGQGEIVANSFSGNDASNPGPWSLALAIEATTGTNLKVAGNLFNDDREFTPEIRCTAAPITIAASNVFASPVSGELAGTCVVP